MPSDLLYLRIEAIDENIHIYDANRAPNQDTRKEETRWHPNPISDNREQVPDGQVDGDVTDGHRAVIWVLFELVREVQQRANRATLRVKQQCSQRVELALGAAESHLLLVRAWLFHGRATIALSGHDHAEKDRGAHEGKEERLGDLLPVLVDVLLAEHGKIYIDEDEERAHKATDYADYDGGRDVPQGGLFVVKLTEFQSTSITERKCGAGPERVVNAEEEGADGARRENTPKHAKSPKSVRFGYFIAE